MLLFDGSEESYRRMKELEENQSPDLLSFELCCYRSDLGSSERVKIV